MIPQKLQHVKCILKNSTLVEGIVEKWSESEVILKSLDGENILIIHGGITDISLTKIILASEDKKIQNVNNLVSSKLKEVIDVPSEESELKDKTVKELIELKTEQEKKIILDKAKEHTVNGIRTITYGTPQFFKK